MKDADEKARPNQAELLDIITAHVSGLLKDEKRKGRTSQRMNRVFFKGIIPADETPPPGEDVSEVETTIFRIIESYTNLAQMVPAVRQCEYYFRRFPFSELPVTRNDHLRNVCEMYFDRVMQFRDRLKVSLNICKDYKVIDNNEVSRLIKLFNRVFAFEHKSRNTTHHLVRFDYDDLNQLGMVELIGHSFPAEIASLLTPRSLYRKAAAQWVQRVRTRSEGLGQIVEYVAGLMLQCPPVVALREKK